MGFNSGFKGLTHNSSLCLSVCLSVCLFIYLHASTPKLGLTPSWPAGHICPTFKESKSLFKSAGITVSHFFSMLPSTLKYLYSVEPVRMHFPAKQPCANDTVCNAPLQHCTQYHLHTAVSRENTFWLVQRNRDTSRQMAAWRKSGILLSQRTWKDYL